MILSAALLATVLAAAPACLQDGDSVAGRFKWLSLTRPNGKPIPAPYLALDLPVCIPTAHGAFSSYLLRLLPRDMAALEVLHEGDTLVVSAHYGLPADHAATGDIAAYDALLERP